MPKENFIDRVQSAQQNINNGYQNEEQRKTAEVRRELEEIGVISAFRELVDSRVMTAENYSDKPLYIECSGKNPFSGCFLVVCDKYNYRPAIDRFDSPSQTFFREAIGVRHIGNSRYEVGYYSSDSHLDPKPSNWMPCEFFSKQDIGTKKVEKDEILDTLATIIAVFNHNKKEKERGSSNFLKYP